MGTRRSSPKPAPTLPVFPTIPGEDIATTGMRKVAFWQDHAISQDNERLRALLRNLIATIELHTDCMSNLIDRTALDPYIEDIENYFGKGEI